MMTLKIGDTIKNMIPQNTIIDTIVSQVFEKANDERGIISFEVQVNDCNLYGEIEYFNETKTNHGDHYNEPTSETNISISILHLNAFDMYGDPVGIVEPEAKEIESVLTK